MKADKKVMKDNIQHFRTSTFIKDEYDYVSRLLTGEQRVIDFEAYDAQVSSGKGVKMNSKESRQ